MKISVITIALNDESRIARTLESMRAQTRRADEYIVIDGLSSDNTNVIVREFYDIVTTHISEKDGGIYNAMNKGICTATGDWIGIINAGDFYLSDTIEKIERTLENLSADIAHGDQLVFTEYKSFTYFRVRKPSPDTEDLEKRPSLFHPTCFVKRTLYEGIGMFDESFKIDADYEFLVRAKRAGAKFIYLPYTLAGFQDGGVSGGCARFSEAYRILRIYRMQRYTSNTMKLIRCIMLKCFARLVCLESRLEKRRKYEFRS